MDVSDGRYMQKKIKQVTDGRYITVKIKNHLNPLETHYY